MFSFLTNCFSSSKKNLPKPPTPPPPKPETPSSDDDNHHGHNIAPKWKHLMGQDHWEGLLEPLDFLLRRTIIHYGEMAQATYDTFINDKHSKFIGLSRFSKKDFFAKVGLEKGHPYKYRVTKFFYATSGPQVAIKSTKKETNFMGYVAVAEDESVVLLGRRDIVVAWRGTEQSMEWVNNFQFLRVSASEIFSHDGEEDDEPDAGVHRGWLSMYTSDQPGSQCKESSARHQVLTELRRLLEQFKDEEISITVTGHSLGASLATLNAADIVANKINQPKGSPKNTKPCMVTAILFASPRVGDSQFKKKLSQYNELRVLRIRNALDIVPNYPLVGYSDVGEELKIDTTQSPYLKGPGTFTNWHNLEVYLHGVVGTQGSKGGFKLEVERDISLLNKVYEILKDEYNVPFGWWVLKNKGLVQQVDGSWLLTDHEMDEDDLPTN